MPHIYNNRNNNTNTYNEDHSSYKCTRQTKIHKNGLDLFHGGDYELLPLLPDIAANQSGLQPIRYGHQQTPYPASSSTARHNGRVVVLIIYLLFSPAQICYLQLAWKCFRTSVNHTQVGILFEWHMGIMNSPPHNSQIEMEPGAASCSWSRGQNEWQSVRLWSQKEHIIKIIFNVRVTSTSYGHS